MDNDFDITRQPPTIEDIKIRRTTLSDRILKLKKTENKWWTASFLTGGIPLVLAFVIYFVWFSGNSVKAGLYPLKSEELIVVSSFGFMIAIGFIEVLMMTLFVGITWSVIYGIVYIFVPGNVSALQQLIVIAFALMCVLILLLGHLFERLVEHPLEILQEQLQNLSMLNPEDMPKECLALAEYVKQHPDVKHYIERTRNLGRKPLLGEYKAAKAWHENWEQREKERALEEARMRQVEAARQVCDEF